MKFTCYTGWDQLPESGNKHFLLNSKESVFLSRQWFECLSRAALHKDDTLQLACVVDGKTVLALLPLVRSGGGSTLYSLKHGYTPVYSLLLAGGDREAIVACLARGLSKLRIKGLLLEPVAMDEPNLVRLQQALEAAGFDCGHSFRQYNWVHRLQGESYKEYMAQRPARLRNTIARKRRKLEREHGYEIRLFAGADAAHGMADYHAVYRASWKQSEQVNAVLLECFVGAFSDAGWTRLAILYAGGRPVAAQLWFVVHGKASIFRLVYDEAWRQYSPGSILTSYLMEYVIETDKVSEIDFLVGNDAYKQDWMTERRERFVLGCKKN